MNKTELVKTNTVDGQALQIIDEREVLEKEFRIYGTWEKPLFLAKDVANWIEHSAVHMMMKNVDEDEKVRNNVSTLGGIQEAWFLTEDGLYEVLMQSRKKIAKDFKKQVKHILKEVRKNGGYIVEGRESEFADKLPKTFKEALLLLVEAEEEKERLIADNNKKQELLVAQAPMIDLYNDFINSDSIYSVNEIAKCLAIKDLGRNNLYRWLRWNKIIMEDSREAFQPHVNAGYIIHRIIKYPRPKYAMVFNVETGKKEKTLVETKYDQDIKAYFTAKGVEWLYKKLVKDGYVIPKTLKEVAETLKPEEE